MKLPLPLLACLLVTLLAIMACSKPEEPATVTASSQNNAYPSSPATPANHGADLMWSTPAGWSALPASPMVLNSYQKDTPAGPVKLSVSAFPGNVGGDLANVNRWRRQIGLGPVTPETLSTVLKEVSLEGRSWKKTSLRNEDNALLIAYTMSAGKSWFFKISGTSTAVESIEGWFDSYLASVQSQQ